MTSFVRPPSGNLVRILPREYDILDQNLVHSEEGIHGRRDFYLNETMYIHFSKVKPHRNPASKYWASDPVTAPTLNPDFLRLFQLFWMTAQQVCIFE